MGHSARFGQSAANLPGLECFGDLSVGSDRLMPPRLVITEQTVTPGMKDSRVA
jgi:hypothetical protein